MKQSESPFWGNPPKHWISSRQVADIFGISQHTVKRWAINGYFGDPRAVVMMTDGGHWRFNPTLIEECRPLLAKKP